MLITFFLGAALYAAVSFLVFATMAVLNVGESCHLSMLFIEWLFVSFFIFSLIMLYIIWSTPNA